MRVRVGLTRLVLLCMHARRLGAFGFAMCACAYAWRIWFCYVRVRVGLTHLVLLCARARRLDAFGFAMYACA